MKVKKLECPYCGGNLDLSKFNVVNFCPYCGKRVILEDENTITINHNIYTKQEQRAETTNRVIDEGKVAEEHRKAEEEKTTRTFLIVYVIVFVIALLVCSIMSAIEKM